MYPLYLPSSFLWSLQYLTHLSGWTVQKAWARSTCCSLHTYQRPRAGRGKSFRRGAPARTPMAHARPAIGSAAVTAATRCVDRSKYGRGSVPPSYVARQRRCLSAHKRGSRNAKETALTPENGPGVRGADVCCLRCQYCSGAATRHTFRKWET